MATSITLINFLSQSARAEGVKSNTRRTDLLKLIENDNISWSEGKCSLDQDTIKGIYNGFKYVREMIQAGTEGYMTSHLIESIHMQTRSPFSVMFEQDRSGFRSKCKRIYFEDELHYAPSEHDIHEAIDYAISGYHLKMHEWCALLREGKPFEAGSMFILALSKFIMRFLELHPFVKGNGIVARILMVFAFMGFGVTTPVYTCLLPYAGLRFSTNKEAPHPNINLWIPCLLYTREHGNSMYFKNQLLRSISFHKEYIEGLPREEEEEEDEGMDETTESLT